MELFECNRRSPPGSERELGDQGCEVNVLESVLLSRDSGSVDEDAVLVDDVDDGGDLVLARTVLEDDDATDLDKLLERLKERRNRMCLML